MKYFAKIENLIVTNVILCDDEKWIKNNLEGLWIETSITGKIRFQYAALGYTYDEGRDAFIAPKANCHAEEVLDETTCRWICANPEHNVKIS